MSSVENFIVHPVRDRSPFSQQAEAFGPMSATQYSAKWYGNGNSHTLEVHAQGGNFDPLNKLTPVLKVEGEWEIAELISFLRALQNVALPSFTGEDRGRRAAVGW